MRVAIYSPVDLAVYVKFVGVPLLVVLAYLRFAVKLDSPLRKALLRLWSLPS